MVYVALSLTQRRSRFPMKTDSVFYRLFQRLPSLVLDLAEIFTGYPG